MEQGRAGGGLDRLAPIERETVQDRVYRQLRSSLICGGFNAGEVLLANDLAQRLSVSSMPVREALARLASERALEALPNRRVRVPILAQDRAQDIVKARCLIEGDLALRALPRLTSADLRALNKLAMAYDAASDPHDMAQTNHAFHFVIYGKAESSVLLPVVESLWMQAGPYSRAAIHRFGAREAMVPASHHVNIIEALRGGGHAGVAAVLDAGIRHVFDMLERAAPDAWATDQTGA